MITRKKCKNPQTCCKNWLRRRSAAANANKDQNSVCQCAHVVKRITLAVMSFLLTPLTQLNTQPHPPLSLAAPASCLSCWSQLTSTRDLGRFEGRGVGVVGLTAEQMQKPLLGLLRTGSFPATPQPCSCPGTSCPDDRTKQTGDFFTVVVG